MDDQPAWISGKDSGNGLGGSNDTTTQASTSMMVDYLQPPTGGGLRTGEGRTRDDEIDHFVERMIQVWHGLDGLMGIVLVVLGWLNHHPGSETFGILLWLVGGLLLVRATLAVLSYKFPSTANLILWNVRISSWVSLLLVLIYASFAIAIGAQPAHRRKDCHDHTIDIPCGWFDKNTRPTWVALLILAGFELVRWYVIYQYRIMVLGDGEVRPLRFLRQRVGQRPWWWAGRNSGINSASYDPLLSAGGRPSWAEGGDQGRSYEMEEGLSPRAGPPQSMFGRMFGFGGGNGTTSQNLRDDGSVDFASVQEDWASRSEEDPYWWTREEQRAQSSPRAG